MKKILLIVAAACVASFSFAQDPDPSKVLSDQTPSAWQFDKATKGEAYGLFFRDAGCIGPNFQLPEGRTDGRTGFRYADNSATGGFSVAHFTGEGNIAYKDLTEEQKNDLEAFYKTWQITDGGNMGNILIYKGKTALAKDNRVRPCDSLMNNPQVYFVSTPDLETGENIYYRYTFRVRTILNEDIESTNMTLYSGTSWWDGLPFAGSGRKTSYGSFNLECNSLLNDYWTEYIFELFPKQMKASLSAGQVYDITPLLIKIGLGSEIPNNAILMFDDVKLERVSAVTVIGDFEEGSQKYHKGYYVNPWGEGNDDASDYILAGIVDKKMVNNSLKVVGDEHSITVIDAAAPVRVYNASGQLVASSNEVNTAVEIPVNGKGLYIVQAGKQSRTILK